VVVLLVILLAVLTMRFSTNRTYSHTNGGENPALILNTKAKVIEIYSTQSILVEIIAEIRVGNDGEFDELTFTERTDDDHIFLAGEKVQAVFNSEVDQLRSLAAGEIVIIGRGNTARIDFSKEPYITQCYAIWREQDFYLGLSELGMDSNDEARDGDIEAVTILRETDTLAETTLPIIYNNAGWYGISP